MTGFLPRKGKIFCAQPLNFCQKMPIYFVRDRFLTLRQPNYTINPPDSQIKIIQFRRIPSELPESASFRANPQIFAAVFPLQVRHIPCGSVHAGMRMVRRAGFLAGKFPPAAFFHPFPARSPVRAKPFFPPEHPNPVPITSENRGGSLL